MNAADPRPPWGLRALLRLYPRRYREAFAAEMAATFDEKLRKARAGGPAHVRTLWARTVVDLLRTALAERWHSSLDGGERLSDNVGTAGRLTGGFMHGIPQDLRLAVRGLRHHPAYALFVAATLALGIGATTAVFSVVDGVLLEPLPHPASERLVAIHGRFVPESGFDYPEFPLSLPEFVDYRDGLTTLDAAAAWQTFSMTVDGEAGEPERVAAAAVTPNLLPLLGGTPVIGRGFTDEEARPGGARLAVLSHVLWQSRYGGDPGVLGSLVRLNGTDVQVVGIAPPGFAFPGERTRLWLPLAIDPANPGNRQAHGTHAIGRLAPGATFAALEAETAVLMARWKAQYPDIHTGHFLFSRPLFDDVVGDSGEVLVPLLAATGCLLLIVCANVSSVALARGEARAREMAVRAALGASRSRLVRLTFIESVVLAAIGGAGGVGLAHVAVRALVALEESGVPRAAGVAVDLRVLAFAALASTVTAVLVAMMPAWRAAAARVDGALRADERTMSTGAGRLRFRRLLVAAEVALTVVLVVGAGLMFRSLARLVSVDPGFDSTQVLLGSVSLPAAAYPEAGHVHGFYDELLSRLGALPGVDAATLGTFVPFHADNGVWDFEIDGRPEPGAGQPAWNAAVGALRPGLFEALRVPLIRGRTFTDDDRAGAEPVTVVTESFAGKFFAGEDPIGRRIRVAASTVRPWMTIVGVVGDMRHEGLDVRPRPMYFFSHAQAHESASFLARSSTLVIRTHRAPSSMAAAVRAVLGGLDRTLPLYAVQSMDEAIGGSLAQRRFATTLFGIFAAVGLVLGATGIYGVLAYTVAQRTHEIGIRRALGAPAGRVALHALRQSLWPVAGGLVAGLGAAAYASRWVETQLFEVAPTDALTYLLVAAGVLAVACAACIAPVRRALRITPLTALRNG
jgi:predicted permease